MINEHADKAAHDIADTLASLSETQQQEVRKIVEQAIVASVRETVQECRDAATTCCATDSTMTKQIRDEIKRTETALIANLSALR
ncbi:MAG: hypothetical protein OET44_11155 [Gammaproteobacteria bacterium]|nr:hypothetical protein [Gammaproteobacteria bacterium]